MINLVNYIKIQISAVACMCLLAEWMRYPPCLRCRFGLNISLQLTSSHHARQEMCSWVIRPAALVFHFTSRGEIHTLSGADMLCSFLFSSCTNLWDVGTGCFDVPDMIELIKWNVSLSLICIVFLHSPGPCVSLPLHGPPVCESLISALVAVQMALCWCFTMGLRSVCLMPSTHSNFSTAAVSWLYLSKMILQQASGLLMCTRLHWIKRKLWNHRCSIEIAGTSQAVNISFSKILHIHL